MEEVKDVDNDKTLSVNFPKEMIQEARFVSDFFKTEERKINRKTKV